MARARTAFTAAAEPVRGRCPACDRDFTLTKDGRMRRHGVPDVFPPEPCPGTGQPMKRGAADLPDGSVVYSPRTTYVKDHPSSTAAWRGTRGGYHGDWEVDEALAKGAEIVRIGEELPAQIDAAATATTEP